MDIHVGAFRFPFREDPVAAARESIRTVRQLDALLDRLDLLLGGR